MRKIAILVALYLLNYTSYSQVNIKDSCINAPMFYATYAYQITGGDVGKRFGNNSAIGGGFQMKTKRNWVFGGEFNYMFGGKVKNQESILSSIVNSDGFLITSSGEYAEVHFIEAGYNFSLKAGKIFPVFGSNPNSGIFISLQPGFLQHKIKINNPNNTAPQLAGDYKYGYDEMANGFSATEFLGYMYMGNKRIYSFYAGFEFTQAFTKCRRAFNFNTMTYNSGTNSDFFYSFRVGWLIPLYRRAPVGYYYK